MSRSNSGYVTFLSGSIPLRLALLMSLAVVLFQLKLLNQVPVQFYSLQNSTDIANDLTPFARLIVKDKETKLSTGISNNRTRIKHKDCPFRDSSIVESIYVYPHPGSSEWEGDILSQYARQRNNSSGKNIIDEYPWISNDLYCKSAGIGPYDYNSQLVQYNTELLVRDIIIHPDSCLRTHDPDKATLFYVPYLPSAEHHNGSLFGNMSQSIHGKAIQDIITETKYELWETAFGLTSKYWKRRNGSDHILVFSEPMHGLWHPKSRRGNFHFLHSQFQTHSPIVVSNELSKTFIDMYPRCAKKNILMPYPNTNGRWFNGKLDNEVATKMFERTNIRKVYESPAAIQSEVELDRQHESKKEQELDFNATSISPLRIFGYYYQGGNHGTCTQLRRSMRDEFQCSPSGKMVQRHKNVIDNYSHAYRQATFCPCPGGDSPSAKRNFDALLSGCIPVILSEDFVWPFTAEFDRSAKINNGSSVGENAILLNSNDFSIRLPAQDHENSKFDSPKTCKPINEVGDNSSQSLQSVLDSVSLDELVRLRRGVRKAADAYSYYQKRRNLPDNPLQEGILPDGGAAHALVTALEERASGVLWEACRDEMKGKDISKDSIKKFKC